MNRQDSTGLFPISFSQFSALPPFLCLILTLSLSFPPANFPVFLLPPLHHHWSYDSSSHYNFLNFYATLLHMQFWLNWGKGPGERLLNELQTTHLLWPDGTWAFELIPAIDCNRFRLPVEYSLSWSKIEVYSLALSIHTCRKRDSASNNH